jgi:hypothetical protein
MAVREPLNAGTQHPHAASPDRTAHTMTSAMATVFHPVGAVANTRTLTLYSTAIVSTITTRCTHLSIFSLPVSFLSLQGNTYPAFVSPSPGDLPWSRSSPAPPSPVQSSPVMSSPVMSSHVQSCHIQKLYCPGHQTFQPVWEVTLLQVQTYPPCIVQSKKKNYAIDKSTYKLTKDVLIEILVLVSVIPGS